MEFKAISRYIRISPRKLVVLADSVRKMSPTVAVAKLSQLNKNGADSMKALIESAAANAKVKAGLTLSDLNFKTVEIVRGPAMKRFRAASKGMAHGYQKRMSHMTIVLTQKEKKAVVAPVVKEEEKSKEVAQPKA